MYSVINWRGHSQAPKALIATGGGADGNGSVLLCPYPQSAQHSGSGDVMDQAGGPFGTANERPLRSKTGAAFICKAVPTTDKASLQPRGFMRHLKQLLSADTVRIGVKSTG